MLDDILPTLLQIGLILFCIAIVIYLGTLNKTIARVVSGLLGTALAILVLMAAFTTWDRFCPFHSPLSHFILWALLKIWYFLTAILPLWCIIVLPYIVYIPKLFVDLCISALYLALNTVAGVHWPPVDNYDRTSTIRNLLKWTRKLLQMRSRLSEAPKVLPFSKKDKQPNQLQILAVKRIIFTSDDPIYLSHATANIIAIDDKCILKDLWKDEDFCRRLVELSRASTGEKAAQWYFNSGTDIAASNSPTGTRLTYGALAHIFLLGSDLAPSTARASSTFFMHPEGSTSTLSVPCQTALKSSAKTIKVALVWRYILDREGYPVYVKEIVDAVDAMSSGQIPAGFTPAVISLMTLAASRAEISDAWSDVQGPYTA
ncbi:hypothetical protein FRB90_003733 [Tulasnella sp. 427]|nr:hypothetical protein FRB90_003733 [Tulasnella sp. 427]